MVIELSGQQHPQAKTVVLSAGLGGSGNFWLPQLNALREQYRVVVYDQRGTGRSPDTLPDGYSMQDMAAELAIALAKNGITQCDVVGHALGGLIGLQMALDYPELVSRVVVVNGWLSLDAHTRRCFHVRRDLLLNVGIEAFVRAQPLFLYPADWLSENQARIEAEDTLNVVHFQGMENLLRRLHALMDTDFSTTAAHITQPVLLICSQDDLLVPWTCSETLHAALPNATLKKMQWGGHAMSVTDSQTFNLMLMEWLNIPHPAAATSPLMEPSWQNH
ncbi:pyrimidine utilization protein D [Erwiniaceae bacterium BAC15a-03b]|uniref:Putative carbamate hydrolase RutD n=1 Tax=Winslowiella arboricola TaxID=2978220 RepID=A0A9J6PZM9_9GAMM|nr:pyrimidine utilization protein D [Winslowiella arboricola]MCU5775174.1 pyrimidine utilization protein D [Winslowiella arboricola]MCU5780372.1 pyrimidine utilization protein D [Winslowiella arboricola]